MTTFDHLFVRSDVDSRDEPPTTRAHHGPVGPDEGFEAGADGDDAA